MAGRGLGQATGDDRRQLQRIDGDGGGLRWLEPKTDASVAVLDVPDFVMDALLAQKDRQALLSGSPRWRESGYVFTTQRGGPLEPDNVTHYFPAFLKAHGMRHQRFHDLRHSAASLLLAIGVPLWQLSKILRHAGIAITSDTYGHLYPETSRAAGDAYGAFLGQGRVAGSVQKVDSLDDPKQVAILSASPAIRSRPKRTMTFEG